MPDKVETAGVTCGQPFGQARGRSLIGIAHVNGVEQAQMSRDTLSQLCIRSTREHDLASLLATRLESRDQRSAVRKHRWLEFARSRDALLQAGRATKHPER